MSATRVGYRRWAAHFNELGWNACFVHLPYHYSRVPRGYWNGELAITADLIRNAEGLRQGVIEVRQLMAALARARLHRIWNSRHELWRLDWRATRDGRTRFSFRRVNGADRERRARDLGESGVAFMRRELERANVDPSLVARHFHLSSPLHNGRCATPSACSLSPAISISSLVRTTSKRFIRNGVARNCSASRRVISAIACFATRSTICRHRGLLVRSLIEPAHLARATARKFSLSADNAGNHSPTGSRRHQPFSPIGANE